MLAAMLAAFMSTIDTHMNLASSYFVVDLWKPWRGERMSEREGVLVARIAGVGFLALGGAIAMMNDSISFLFEFLLRLVAGAGAVFLVRWFWWRINAWAELSAMVASLLIATFLTVSNARGWLPHEFATWEVFLINVALSGAVWVTVALRTPPDDEATLRAFVRRTRPLGAWGPYREPGAAGSGGPGIRGRIGLWLVGIAGLYGCLFGIGRWLLQQPGGALLTGFGLIATILVARRAAAWTEAPEKP
jgi:hypothetical protein